MEPSPSFGLLCALWGLASSQDEEGRIFSSKYSSLNIILSVFLLWLLLLLFLTHTYMFMIFQVSMSLIHSLILGHLGCCL